MDLTKQILLAIVLGSLSAISIFSYCLMAKGTTQVQVSIGENLLARVKAWWSMVGVFALTLLVGEFLSFAIWVGISFLALREFVKIGNLHQKDIRVVWWIYGAVIPFHYWLVWIEWYEFFSVFIPVYAFALIPIRLVLLGDSENFLERTAKIQWGLMVCVYFVSHVPALYMLEIPGFEGQNGNLIFFLFAVVEIADVVGFLVASLLAGKSIVPKIKPEATARGVYATLLFASFAGMLLFWMTPFSWDAAVLIAFVLGLISRGGDLVMTAIGRDSGTTSKATLIENGIIDRIDALCFAVPIFFHIVRYFYVS